MAINRRQVLNNLLENIACISDKEYQKRVWIRGEGPECDDFDETVCQFFDFGDPILEKYKDYGITDSQYQILVKFRSAFRAFSDKNDFAHEFIESSEWGEIMKMAKEVMKAFSYEQPNK